MERIVDNKNIDRAIEDLPKDFKILEFILAHRTEVCDMCLFEYDEKKAMAAERQEGREEGIEEGETRERIRLLVKWVKAGKFTVDEVLFKK